MAQEKENKKAQEVVDETPELEIQEGEEQLPEVEETVETPEEELDETAKLTAEVETLRGTVEKMKNDYLLLMAEFDNYRKRTLKEKSELIKNGGENCMKAILPVVDDFERGLAAINESSDVDALKEGMMLIYNKFNAYLEQNGVKEIPTHGTDFDTEYHEAVTLFPAPDQKGKVIDTVQKGYTLNDKVIRFAKVVVGE